MFMTHDQQLIVAFLLDELEKSLHMRDSALQIAQELPGWEEKYQAALQDSLRKHYTQENFAPMRKLLDAFVQGTMDDEEFVRLMSELRAKDPN